ncbi:MAG: hypothetical protein LBE91_05830 [Tannerella sp.]|jgi:hypothetical protein|nr:hypothetical protein [Tannerella sp.]
MDVLNNKVEPEVESISNNENPDKEDFNRMWKNSISGEEWEKEIHKHIIEWWDANRK